MPISFGDYSPSCITLAIVALAWTITWASPMAQQRVKTFLNVQSWTEWGSPSCTMNSTGLFLWSVTSLMCGANNFNSILSSSWKKLSSTLLMPAGSEGNGCYEWRFPVGLTCSWRLPWQFKESQHWITMALYLITHRIPHMKRFPIIW